VPPYPRQVLHRLGPGQLRRVVRQIEPTHRRRDDRVAALLLCVPRAEVLVDIGNNRRVNIQRAVCPPVIVVAGGALDGDEGADK